MDAPNRLTFLAVLIYDDGNGRRSEEPRRYTASHPEIAYRRALADGSEQRFGRTFLGLSHLEETNDDGPLIARSTHGDAQALVVGAGELAALSDPRFRGVPWDPIELEEALRAPDVLFPIEGLDSIAWHTLTHAYGAAVEVPKDLRHLAALDGAVREEARWQLSGSIYHQGTIYPATAAAVPFLLRIAADPRLPDRKELIGFLLEIASSSRTHPDLVRKAWKERHGLFRENFEKVFQTTWQQKAAEEIADKTAVHQAFVSEIESIRRLAAESKDETGDAATKLLDTVQMPTRGKAACLYCRGSGACYCQRLSTIHEQCKRCGGTGKCHVCKGSGDLIVDDE